jgi:hypothetical protein
MAAVGNNLNYSYNKYQESQGSKGGKKSKSKIKMKLKNTSKKLKGGFDDRFKDPKYRLWAAEKLYECYETNNDEYREGKNNLNTTNSFAFPKWVINKDHYNYNESYTKPNFNQFNFKDTVVLYDSIDNLDEVVRTVYFRDPINITMKSSYDPDLLNNHFKYKQSYYLTDYYNSVKNGNNKNVTHEHITKQSNHNYTLKPNIAIYCKAVVNCLNGEIGNGVMCNTTLQNVQVNVMNLIGFGFDTGPGYDKQPDYLYLKYLKDKKNYNDQNLLDEVIILYRKMWLKLAYFIINNNKIINSQNNQIKHVIISNVGGNNFATYLYELIPTLFTKYNYLPEFLSKIYIPSFEYYSNNIVKSPKQILIENNINVVDAVRKSYYFIPGIIDTIIKNNSTQLSNINLKGATLDNTLFVNAWDPHSIIGNGNYNDPSLDGYWGRISNMSVLGWGFTNPEMTYVPVDFTNM